MPTRVSSGSIVFQKGSFLAISPDPEESEDAEFWVASVLKDVSGKKSFKFSGIHQRLLVKR